MSRRRGPRLKFGSTATNTQNAHADVRARGKEMRDSVLNASTFILAWNSAHLGNFDSTEPLLVDFSATLQGNGMGSVERAKHSTASRRHLCAASCAKAHHVCTGVGGQSHLLILRSVLVGAPRRRRLHKSRLHSSAIVTDAALLTTSRTDPASPRCESHRPVGSGHRSKGCRSW